MADYLTGIGNTNIYIHNARLDENLTPGRIYGPVKRDCFVFESCVDGCGSIVINGREFPIKGGDTYFFLPGDSILQKTDKVNPRRGVYCTVGGIVIRDALKKAGITSESPFAPSELHKGITDELYKLYTLGCDNDEGLEFRQTACIYNILGMLLKSLRREPEKSLFIKRAISIMETGYHTEIDITSLADEVGFSRCYFSTAFKNITGVSPYDYLTAIRIRKACMLLKEEDITISETALAVGLDPRNFSRLFKKETGMTPMEFLKQRKKNSL